MRLSRNAILAAGWALAAALAAILAGCSETTPSSGPAAGPVAIPAAKPAAPQPTYGLRLKGSKPAMTSVYVFLRHDGGEREVLVDRCASADVDKGSPEGLLIPIDCDGRRLVLRDEKGRLVMQGGKGGAKDIGPIPRYATYIGPTPRHASYILP